jgi:hypothetical protein
MKSKNLVWEIFLTLGIALVVLVVGLDCLQGSSGIKLFGILECNYGLTSTDFRVKIGATAIFALFLALLFGPIVAVLRRSKRTRRSKTSE